MFSDIANKPPEEQITILKSKRSTSKSQITRFQTFVEALNDTSEVIELEERVQVARQSFNTFQQIQDHLETLDPTTNHGEYCRQVEDTFYKSVGIAKRFIASNTSPNVNSEYRASSVAPSASESVVDYRGLRVPHIEPPEFSGNYEDYLPFIDQFDAIIDQNLRLTDVQKLLFLKRAAKGRPKLWLTT